MDQDIARFIAEETGRSYTSDWIEVDQQLIDGFADLTRDWNFIHVDVERAAQTPLGGTIAHGFLVLSLLAPLRQGCDRPPFPHLTMGMNYGLERVREPGSRTVQDRLDPRARAGPVPRGHGGYRRNRRRRATCDRRAVDDPLCGLGRHCLQLHSR
jgi:hypothetical protein